MPLIVHLLVKKRRLTPPTRLLMTGGLWTRAMVRRGDVTSLPHDDDGCQLKEAMCDLSKHKSNTDKSRSFNQFRVFVIQNGLVLLSILYIALHMCLCVFVFVCVYVRVRACVRPCLLLSGILSQNAISSYRIDVKLRPPLLHTQEALLHIKRLMDHCSYARQ